MTDVERGALEIELVGNARGQVVLLVAHHRGQPAHEIGHVLALEQVPGEVGVVARAGEHADRAGEGARVIAGVLQRLPRGFQEQPLLGIEHLGFLRRDAEEAGIELVDVLEDAARGT